MVCKRDMIRRVVLGLALATGLITGLVTGAAFAMDSGQSQGALARGIRSFGAGDIRTARVELMNAVKADPKNALALAVHARILIELGDGVGAKAQLNRAIALGMPHERIGHLFGHAALLSGDTKTALEETDPEEVPAQFRAYAARIHALALIAADDTQEASRAYDRALEQSPQSSILWSDVGRFRMNTGNLAGAIDAASEAMRFNPRNIDALVLTGELMRAQYGLVAAIPWFERALVVDPGNVRAMGELAATLGDSGRNRDMLAMTRRILAVEPTNAQAFYLQAVLAARANKPDLARSLLYRVGDRLDTTPAVMLLRAILEIESGADEQAIARLLPLLELQPGNIKARRLLGAAMSRAGDAQGTIETLSPIAQRSDADSYTLSIIGRAYEKLGDRANAARFLDRAARPQSSDPTPFSNDRSLARLSDENARKPGNASTAVPLISSLIASGRAGEALSEAIRLERQHPGVPATHVLVGDSLTALGRHKEAVEAYQNAANIRFSENTALRLVRAQGRAGNSAGAIKTLDLFLGQNPRSVPGRLLASEYFLETGQWGRAISTLEGLRDQIGNRDTVVLTNLATAYLNAGKPELARAYAKASYNLAPSNPAVVNTYGWVLFKTRHDKATGLALLEKASAIAPNHPGMRFQLAQAYAALGRKGEAKQAVTKALATPGFDEHKAATALLATL
jgi:cellulose synthase operon protein C